MKVLWITFTLFPEAQELYTGNRTTTGSGGWLFNAASSLINSFPEIDLKVACVNAKVKNFTTVQGGQIGYYLIPYGQGFDSYNHGYDRYWQKITFEFCPDVVHVHGIEATLALTYVRACSNKNVVCSIQGLPNIISRYLMLGVDKKTIWKNITLRDIVRHNTYLSVVKADQKRAGYIYASMNEVKYFIGRTKWDRTHLWAANPSAKYFFCNETLRDEFYKHKWEYARCKPHTIFLSAVKGIQIFLQALPIIIANYPDTMVYVAGNGNPKNCSFIDRLKMTNFQHIVYNMIKSHHLEGKIEFLGPLTEESMIKNYLMANVFVCPSTCENSSNSIAEAQLLGVPVVASYVGGTPDLIPDPDCGTMYRCEEYEMLAGAVCDVFENANKFDNAHMMEIAARRHNAKINAETTMNIYRQIINEQN